MIVGPYHRLHHHVRVLRTGGKLFVIYHPPTTKMLRLLFLCDRVAPVARRIAISYPARLIYLAIAFFGCCRSFNGLARPQPRESRLLMCRKDQVPLPRRSARCKRQTCVAGLE